MNSIIIGLFKSALYLIPFIITYLIFKYEYRKNQNKKISLQKSVNYSTVIYLMGVLYLFNEMFGSFFIGYLLIIFLIALSIILVLQMKNNNEVILIKGLKRLWKISFLIFLGAYVILLFSKLTMFIYQAYLL